MFTCGASSRRQFRARKRPSWPSGAQGHGSPSRGPQQPSPTQECPLPSVQVLAGRSEWSGHVTVKGSCGKYLGHFLHFLLVFRAGEGFSRRRGGSGEGTARLPGWGGCGCVSGECSFERWAEYLNCKLLSVSVLLKFLCYESLCTGGAIFLHQLVIGKVIIHTALQINVVRHLCMFFPSL